MKRMIRASEENYQLYRNKRNENKYIEVKKSADGHTYYRQFMFWNTDTGSVKNYSGSRTNRGRYHRTTLETLNKILDDYVLVESVEDDVKSDYSYVGGPVNPNAVTSSIDVSDYDMLSSTIKDNGQAYALFRKRCDGKTCWAAAKYVEGEPDVSNAFEISYDQARGFKPLSAMGELSRTIHKKLHGDGIISSTESNWPEPLTYAEYDEGDQIIEGFIKALHNLDIYVDPSAQGGHGTDYFYSKETDEELAKIDIDEEIEILTDLYWDSYSKKNYRVKVENWLSDLCKLS